MIDIEIGIVQPELTLQMPANQDTLPLVRQALRSLGETVDADIEALEDAELAVTEACANAVEHAYADGEGDIEVRFSPGESELEVSVADQGVGIPVDIRTSGVGGGFGLPMIDSIATSVDFADGDGTRITMALPLGRPEPPVAVDGALPGVEPAERILRRLVAVVAAQRDMSSERVMEGLLLAELVARNALRYLTGDTVSVAHRPGRRRLRVARRPARAGWRPGRDRGQRGAGGRLGAGAAGRRRARGPRRRRRAHHAADEPARLSCAFEGHRVLQTHVNGP